MKVLVVDDAPLIRNKLVELLEAIPDVEVVGVAENAPRAFERTQALGPDLVTLDLHMRGGDGFEYLQRLRGVTQAPHVVVLTNYFDEQYRRRCLALGALAFLDKSRQFSELPQIISGLQRPPQAVTVDETSKARKSMQGTGTEAGGSIILVEDNDLVRSFASRVLVSKGYEVFEFSTPAEALASTDGQRFALLVTDIMMPGMSGFELADALRRERPHLRVLFLSGYSERDVIEDRQLEPGTVFLSKPFGVADFLAVVRELLDEPGQTGTS